MSIPWRRSVRSRWPPGSRPHPTNRSGFFRRRTSMWLLSAARPMPTGASWAASIARPSWWTIGGRHFGRADSPTPIVPADAGTQTLPAPKSMPLGKGWIPASAGMSGGGSSVTSSRRISARPLLVAAVALAAAVLDPCTARADDFYRGKTVTLFAAQPPGGGIDSEMRLVARSLGKFIPGEPGFLPMNMQGAGGIILGNHLYGVAKPDGLTLGMPGRAGFALAP